MTRARAPWPPPSASRSSSSRAPSSSSTDYEAAGFNEGFSAYGGQSYDAANVIIQAFAKALPDAASVEAARPQIVEAVGATQGYAGVTGEHSFDEFGDTSNKALTVYKADGRQVDGGVLGRVRDLEPARPPDPGRGCRAASSARGARPRGGRPPVREGAVDEFVQQLANGVTKGSYYALIALGYTMVYGIIQLINFAHGEVFMLGAMIGLWTFNFGASAFGWGSTSLVALVVVMAMATLLTPVVGVSLERFAYRPLRNAPRLAPLITALGASFALQQLVAVFYSRSFLSFPDLFPTPRSNCSGPGSRRCGCS